MRYKAAARLRPVNKLARPWSGVLDADGTGARRNRNDTETAATAGVTFWGFSGPPPDGVSKSDGHLFFRNCSRPPRTATGTAMLLAAPLSKDAARPWGRRITRRRTTYRMWRWQSHAKPWTWQSWYAVRWSTFAGQLRGFYRPKTTSCARFLIFGCVLWYQTEVVETLPGFGNLIVGACLIRQTAIDKWLIQCSCLGEAAFGRTRAVTPFPNSVLSSKRLKGNSHTYTYLNIYMSHAKHRSRSLGTADFARVIRASSTVFGTVHISDDFLFDGKSLRNRFASSSAAAGKRYKRIRFVFFTWSAVNANTSYVTETKKSSVFTVTRYHLGLNSDVWSMTYWGE